MPIHIIETIQRELDGEEQVIDLNFTLELKDFKFKELDRNHTSVVCILHNFASLPESVKREFGYYVRDRRIATTGELTLIDSPNFHTHTVFDFAKTEKFKYLLDAYLELDSIALLVRISELESGMLQAIRCWDNLERDEEEFIGNASKEEMIQVMLHHGAYFRCNSIANGLNQNYQGVSHARGYMVRLLEILDLPTDRFPEIILNDGNGGYITTTEQLQQAMENNNLYIINCLANVTTTLGIYVKKTYNMEYIRDLKEQAKSIIESIKDEFKVNAMLTKFRLLHTHEHTGIKENSETTPFINRICGKDITALDDKSFANVKSFLRNESNTPLKRRFF